MSHDREPLSPEMQALVDAARPLTRVPAASRDAVRQRLAASLAVPLAPPPAPAPAPATASVAALAHHWPITLAAFVAGGLAGAGAHRALSAPRAPVTVVRVVQGAPAPAAVVAAPVVVAVVADDVPAVVTTSDVPAVVASDAPAHSHGGHEADEGSLNGERAVLEIARTALTRGQGSAAIDALERHARRFPRGRLAPERDSMWVQALVSAGRYDSAREHAARFRRSYPGSMLQAVVDAALREIP